MEHDNVWYIDVQPYTYNVSYNQLIEKYFKANKELFEQFNKTEYDFVRYMSKILSNDFEYLDKTKVEKNIDLLISKKIENNIKKFLGKKSKNTRKQRKQTMNQTRRN